MSTRTAKQEALDARKPKRAHLCLAENCRTIVLGETYCWRHRAPREPQGSWAVAAAIKREAEVER